MKKLFAIILITALFTGALAGCKRPAKPADGDTAGQINGNTLDIKVGTTGTYEPFSYVGKDGRLTGYDIEVLRLIQTTDPTLNFEFIAGSWDSLFPGLDADKFQLLANQIASTPERLAKYYLTDNSYFLGVSHLIVKKGRTDIKSLKDLQGKKIGATVGSTFTRFIEDWNNENGKILNIVYYEADTIALLQDIENGRIDAILNDPIMAVEKAKAQKLDVEPVGERIQEPETTHFIMKKDEEGALIKRKIDAALAKIRADGSLSKLSINWFGVDYSQ